jgi:acetolactate synthase-1/2/3 large subunit
VRQVDGFENWLAEAQKLRDGFYAQVIKGVARENGLHALDIVEALEEVLSPETVVVVDGGNIGQWFHQSLGSRRYPGHYLTCGASGVVGFGIAGAMAARVGFPKRPVVLLCGDGAATFTLAELECAARQRLPFVMIVADDESWGITESGHLQRYGEAMSSTLGPVDFAAVAQGLGALGARISSKSELVDLLRRGLEESVPTLIHVPIVGGMAGSE